MKTSLRILLLPILAAAILLPMAAVGAKPAKQTKPRREARQAAQQPGRDRISGTNSISPANADADATGPSSEPALTQPAFDTLQLNIEVYSPDSPDSIQEGTIEILLYPDPNLKEYRNRLMIMANNHCYDSIQFHRVIRDFMIQIGDPTTRSAVPGSGIIYGSAGIDTIRNEPQSPFPFVNAQFPRRYHKRGAIGIARVGDAANPQRLSSISQFYIVTDTRKPSEADIRNYMARRRDSFRQALPDSASLYGRYYPTLSEATAANTPAWQEMVRTYAQTGGAYYLDEDYVVIGEITGDGSWNMVNRIQSAQTDQYDRPSRQVFRIKSTRYIPRKDPASSSGPLRGVNPSSLFGNGRSNGSNTNNESNESE